MFLTSLSLGQETSQASYAVLDFDAMGVSVSESGILASRLRSELVRSAGATVVERSAMSQILKEQDFQLEGCTSDECAVEVGQLLGVSVMIAGSMGKLGSTYSIDLRAIDVSTGKITRSVIRDYKGEIDVLLSVMSSIAAELLSDNISTGIPATSIQSSSPEPVESISIPIEFDGSRTVTNGDVVIVHIFTPEGRSYLAKGSVIGIHTTEDIIQISIGSNSEVLAQAREVLPVSGMETQIGSGFAVGGEVTYYSDGFHVGTVNKIDGIAVAISAVEIINGLQFKRETSIPRNLIISRSSQ